jgi:hypothetical protein
MMTVEIPGPYFVQYTGTKTLLASPMTLGEYNLQRGWVIPVDEDPEAPGYMVVYEDEYISWSPAAAFEASYRPSGTWEARLLIERDQLAERTQKLAAFVASEQYLALNLLERSELRGQLSHMQAYLASLNGRLGV